MRRTERSRRPPDVVTLQTLNLKHLSISELGAALAPANPTRTALFKVFAQVFAHGAQSVEQVAKAPQVTREVARVIRETGEMPSLKIVERRKAADGFVKYLF